VKPMRIVSFATPKVLFARIEMLDGTIRRIIE
jgi:hypothetical protein